MNERTLSTGERVFYDSASNLEILDREFLQDGLYEHQGIVLNEGDCIFDVGANIGFFVLHMNQRLSDATLHAFEPIPSTFEVLKKNADRLNRLNLYLHNYGIGREDETVTFTHFRRTSVASTMYHQDDAEFRQNSRRFVLKEMKSRSRFFEVVSRLVPEFIWFPLTECVRRYYQVAETIECRLRPLSDVIEETGVERIDLLKVDTEGAEHDVLAGISEQHWPRIRQTVIEAHQGENSARQIEAVLRKHGFTTSIAPAMEGVEHLYFVFGTRKSAN